METGFGWLAGPSQSSRELVVFSSKGFIQDLIGSRLERLDPAFIASADQDRDPALDVSFVAPLPKCHSFHALSHAPLFADFANDGFVFGGHRPIPAVAVPAECLRHVLWECVSYFTLGRELLPHQVTSHLTANIA